MDKRNLHIVHAEVHAQFSDGAQENSRLAEPDFRQDGISSTSGELSASVERHCSDGCSTAHNIKMEDEPQGALQEDAVCSRQTRDGLANTDVETTSRKHKQLNEQGNVLHFQNTVQLPTLMHNDNELIKVKEEPTDFDEYARDDHETRHQDMGGVLNEIKRRTYPECLRDVCR